MAIIDHITQSNPALAPSTLVLTAQQRSALDAITEFATGAHGARMMTLEGFAGTGKTTLVAELVNALCERMAIAIAAPTNKAVGVLREKIGANPRVDYGSIHSFMGLRLRERDDGRHECTPEGSSSVHGYQLIVVDECSMLGGMLFGQLAQQIHGGDTRILFVGDPAQLPPVGDRDQASPTFTRVQHRAILTDIVRQVADHPIIGMSLRIREAIEQGVRMTPAMIASAMPAPPSDALFAQGGSTTAHNWALHDILEGHDTRILAFRNQTVLNYNRAIHAAVHGTDTPFAVGEVVMLNSAHDAREDLAGTLMRARRVSLYNSEEVVVEAIILAEHPSHPDTPAWRLTVRRDTGQRVAMFVPTDHAALNTEISQLFGTAARLKGELIHERNSEKDQVRKDCIANAWALRNDFADARHIYAMTVHKSQGSTLHTAIVDLDDLGRMRDDFDYNRALYVATTRAARRLAFIAL